MKCKICNENNCLEAFVKDVIKCTNCGSLYNMSTLYEEIPVITTINNKLKLSAQKKVSKLIAKSYLSHLKKKTKTDFKNALDIGCGLGDFVEELNKIGIKASGIESDADTVKNAKSNVNYGLFDESYYSTIKYDLISINQTLYYFEDSFAIIKKISSLLEVNGVILVATINAESSFIQKHKLWTQGCKLCLGNKIWKNFDKFGLKCIDLTTYDDNLYIDFFLHKTNLMSNTKFLKNTLLYLSLLKKIITPKEDGINNFVLLQKVRET
jgi:2-polyprenyl-3-methyl-5-hydroxy-6-metoxy-1,4-benzoquinol methylase